MIDAWSLQVPPDVIDGCSIICQSCPRDLATSLAKDLAFATLPNNGADRTPAKLPFSYRQYAGIRGFALHNTTVRQPVTLFCIAQLMLLMFAQERSMLEARPDTPRQVT
jgi:hypothetical protein